MERPSIRVLVFIVLAVALAALAAWQFLPGGEEGDGDDPDRARIAELRRAKNLDALGREVRNPSEQAARHAITALGRIGTEAMDHVREALDDKRPRVREKAATTYARIAQWEDGAPLAKLVRQDGSANVRAAAVSGLERMFAYDQMETILAAMEDEDVIVRRRAAEAARRFAGVRVGFKAEDPPAKRKAALARMRAEWTKHKARAEKYWQYIRGKYKADPSGGE